MTTLKDIVPDFDGHKGEKGKVAVFGGCYLYTGAPYFVAMSALRLVCCIITAYFYIFALGS